MKKLAPVPLLVLALLVLSMLSGGCHAPPVGGEVAGPPPRVPGANAVLGDAAGAAWSETQVRRPARKPGDATPPLLASAKALADQGEHAAASAAYESIYHDSARSRLAEDALYFAADEAFKANQHYRSLELFDKLLVLYPTTAHYPDVLQSQFQIGKLYVEEKAKRPSWFLGVDKTDASYGIDILEKFVKQRDQHELAPQALYLVGEAHIRADEPELAIESWQRLVKDYPRSAWAKLGEYRIALAFISLSYGVDYDKRPLITGRKRLKAYTQKYTADDNIQAARAKLRELEELLAQHDLAIARKYASRDKFRAGQIYLSAIQREYPETNAAKEAKQLASEWENPKDPPPPEEPR